MQLFVDNFPTKIDFVLQTTFQTETGQTLDLITKPGERFCNFTLDRYIFVKLSVLCGEGGQIKLPTYAQLGGGGVASPAGHASI